MMKNIYVRLIKDYFWFYKASMDFMSHQPRWKTFFQAIPKSFGFVALQYKDYKELKGLYDYGTR